MDIFIGYFYLTNDRVPVGYRDTYIIHWCERCFFILFPLRLHFYPFHTHTEVWSALIFAHRISTDSTFPHTFPPITFIHFFPSTPSASIRSPSRSSHRFTFFQHVHSILNLFSPTYLTYLTYMFLFIVYFASQNRVVLHAPRCYETSTTLFPPYDFVFFFFFKFVPVFVLETIIIIIKYKIKIKKKPVHDVSRRPSCGHMTCTIRAPVYSRTRSAGPGSIYNILYT